MSVARHIAVKALGQARSEKAFASDVLDELFSAAPDMYGPDRRLTTHLVLGVTRRRATLDALIAPFVNRSLENIELPVLDVLHLGAYQMAFLDQIPPHAAVHETVELAKVIGRPDVKGFLNGVLRRVCEIVTDDVVSEPARDAVPLETIEPRYRRLRQPILPSPGTPDYLAAAFSWPHWLAERWLKRDGFAECCRRGFWFNAAPPLWIRVNKRQSDRENYRIRLAAMRLDAEPGEHPQSLLIHGTSNVLDLPGYVDGDFAVQDHASMLVASALDPKSGMTILDLCSAPGGKTTHLAELMDDRGSIIACDIDAKRLDTVAKLAERLKLTSIKTHWLAEDGEPPPGPFDAALVDAPCSNTGVLGRRPEVRWRLKPREFEHLIRLQTRLLLSAVERVKPGGTIIYSTCSIEPDENENLIRGVCATMKGIRLEAEHHAIHGSPADGGYWARLRKT